MSFNTPYGKADKLEESLGSQYAVDSQRHDRISVTDRDTSNMSGSNKSSGQDEITVTQRMVSATVGSVLTSLLGMLSVTQVFCFY